MTRINVVPPQELHRLHLIAEYRELPGIFYKVRGHQMIGRRPDVLTIPDTYRYGEGHQSFFYNKLMFLNNRQILIVLEMQRREYSPRHLQPLRNVFSDLYPHWWGDWVPDEAALALNRQRLLEQYPRGN